ncbi:MAG: chorismate synthase [Bacteroidales bacterium]|nr:chorismate synthase [Bacteroidales bacterium]
MNTFGRIFRLTDFGETHGPCMGGVIDGCPSGLLLDMDFIRHELERRALSGDGRRESDKVRFVSGLYEGRTTGAPVAFLIDNEDGQPNAAADGVLKPSHSSFVYKEKYEHTCNEQGGRSSARQTVCRVVGGAVAKLLLRERNITVTAEMLSMARIETEGDTAGALVVCVISGLPAGLGEPVYDKFDARLAAAMLSLPACKGFEIGEGFHAAEMCGTQYNDLQNSDFSFRTNHDGGVQAGITNGEEVRFRVAFKPIPSVRVAQQTVDYCGNPVTYTASNRNDACAAPRVLPVVEAMAALVTADFLLIENGKLKTENLRS